MIKTALLILTVCCISAACICGPFARAELIDKIVVILDDELILLSEVREKLQKPAVKALVNLEQSEDIEEEALAYVIERRLLLREVQYLAIPKDADLVASLATQYLVNTYHDRNTVQFKQQLQASGLGETQLTDELMLYMKGFDYIRRKYRFNADVDEDDVVMKLFRQWVDDLTAKAEIRKLP